MNKITIGMDLGDKKNTICILDSESNKIATDHIENNRKGVEEFFSKRKGATVVIEAGTHSPWISRQLALLECRVLVGNPRKLRAIWDNDQKDDIRDAELLARIGNFDPELLYPINHRGEQAQIDLELLKARDMLVKIRSSTINHVRSVVKSFGERLPQCSSPSFHKKVADHIPEALGSTLHPLLETIADTTEKIKEYDQRIEAISQERYPETELLRAISGVGPLTALAFIAILEDPNRFDKSRQVGKFLGLTPKIDQSGETDKQLRITKAGNIYLRTLLVQAAQYILGPFGPDCDLRRFGLRITERGGKNAKRRAVVATARKLSVLMHGLWRNGEVYDPDFKLSIKTFKKAA